MGESAMLNGALTLLGACEGEVDGDKGMLTATATTWMREDARVSELQCKEAPYDTGANMMLPVLLLGAHAVVVDG